MNAPDTYLGIISLHRSAKIRVKQYGGNKVNLHPTQVTWVNTEDDYNLAQLNHHSAVGQYLVIGQWNNLFCGPTPPVTDLENHAWWISVRTLNDTARIRVKGWQYDPETDTTKYGHHNLKPNVNTWFYIGYVPYDNDASVDRGIEDEGDWKYNLRQLGHHESIGQYVVSDGSWVNIQALNRNTKVRTYNSQNNTYRTASTNLNAVDTPIITSISTSPTGGSLNQDTEYYYVVTPIADVGYGPFESEYSQSAHITTDVNVSGNAQQTIQFQNITGGAFNLAFNNIFYNGSTQSFSVTNLAWNISAGDLINAINAACNTAFGTSGLDYVTGGRSGTNGNCTYTINYDGELANTYIDMPDLTDTFTGSGRSVHNNMAEEPTASNTATVTLSWTPVHGAIGYNVYRSQDNIFDVIPTTDGYRVANNITATTFTDDGSSTDNAIPDPYWWTGLVPIYLDNDKSRNSLNHHTAVGQYIVWPFELNNNNND